MPRSTTCRICTSASARGEDFYRIAGRLPKETRDYVPKLVAVARIAKQPTKYGFTD
jgi:hypothetical protein